MEAPAMYNKGVLVDVNTATQDEIDTLPDFIKDKIKGSEEYDKRFRQEIVVGVGGEVEAIDNIF
jgi:hypothetical protein